MMEAVLCHSVFDKAGHTVPTLKLCAIDFSRDKLW